MKTFFAGYLDKSVDLAIMLAIVAVTTAVGYFLRRQVLGRLSRWARENDSLALAYGIAEPFLTRGSK